jgi:5-methylcytosine-specific restriction protein A
MSRRRFYGKDRKKLKRGKNGRFLCRFCETEVTPPKRTFCSKECVHEWRLRTSSSYVRRCLLKRDRGVCAMCKINTVELKKTARSILKNYGREAYWRFAKSFNMPPERKSWFDADHILPVCEGGGECGLENYRLLCSPCHLTVTKQLVKRKAAERKERKKKKPIRLPSSFLEIQEEN